jgi:hypothetical protein
MQLAVQGSMSEARLQPSNITQINISFLTGGLIHMSLKHNPSLKLL